MREGPQGVALSARSAPVLSPTDRLQKTSEYSEYTHIKRCSSKIDTRPK